MNRIFKLSKRKQLNIFPFSDLHLGSAHFNEEYFKFALDKIRGLKSDYIIYLVGDLLESASLSVGNSAFQQEMNLNEQIDGIVDLLEPFKKHIAVSCPGNHEARLKKDFDFDVAKIVADQLECEYQPYIFDELVINDKSFKIFATHGKGTSRYYHTTLGKVERETAHFQADLYIYGHLHRCGHWSSPIQTVDGLKRKSYILSGHFLKYAGSYAEDLGLPELPEGFTQIKISHNHNVNVNNYYRDIIFNEDDY